MTIFERRYIFQTIMFGIYVKFPGCSPKTVHVFSTLEPPQMWSGAKFDGFFSFFENLPHMNPFLDGDQTGMLWFLSEYVGKIWQIDTAYII